MTADTDPKGLYAALGLANSATDDEIKKAYKRLALAHHPDKNPDDPETAKSKFQAISHAYSILSDSEKRQMYDEQGATGEDGDFEEDGTDFYDMFEMIFSNGRVGGRNAQMFNMMAGMMFTGGGFGFSFDEDDEDEEDEMLEVAAAQFIEETEDDRFRCTLCSKIMSDPNEVFSHLSHEHAKECQRFFNSIFGISNGKKKKTKGGVGARKVRAKKRR